jgi:hypothetical protein
MMESGQEVGVGSVLVTGDKDDLTLVLIKTAPDASSGTAQSIQSSELKTSLVERFFGFRGATISQGVLRSRSRF